MSKSQNCRELDKYDIFLIMLFYDNNKTYPMSAYTIEDVENYTKIKMSYQTIGRRLKNLESHNMLSKGLSVGRKKTFYLNEKGIEYLKETREQKTRYDVDKDLINEKD